MHQFGADGCLQENFDDVVRRREIDDKAFLPSRYFELQDAQSTRSLAQIYEDEYQAAASGEKTADPRDAKLTKDHEEIDKLWNDICYKLDALSNLHFTPKAVSIGDVIQKKERCSFGCYSPKPRSLLCQTSPRLPWKMRFRLRNRLRPCSHRKKCSLRRLLLSWCPEQNSTRRRSVDPVKRHGRLVLRSAKRWTSLWTSLRVRVV